MSDSAQDRAPSEGGGSEARGPFRIHAVAELTGVPEPTLRAWERRYGIPKPERGASGYRLYARAEVDQVREMRRLCEGGMAAGEAAKLLVSSRGAGEPAAEPPTPRPSAHASAIASILEAIRRFDDAALDLELRKLMFLGTAISILDEVIAPALVEVGRLWHEGELSVAQEHLASQRLSTLLRDLLRLSPGSQAESTVVLGSFAEDDHELGLLGMALRLSGWGLRPVFLGARTPPGAVRSAVTALDPALVALSVTISPQRARARELVDDYASACGEVPWIVGGAASEGLRDMVLARGGRIAPTDPTELRRMIRAALAPAASNPSSKQGKTSKPRNTP